MASNVKWLVLSLLACGQALSAADWNMASSTSSVSFRAIQQGSPFEGEFSSFSAQIQFDPGDPSSGSIVGVVETGSVRTGDSERDRTLLDREWFDPNNHPESRFESDSIEVTDTGFRAQRSAHAQRRHPAGDHGLYVRTCGKRRHGTLLGHV